MRTKDEILDQINKTNEYLIKVEHKLNLIKNDLQKELEELNKPKRWKPEVRDFYWFINPHGEVVETDWLSDNYDKFRYKTRNCFKTKEEAEDELERILFVNEVRDFIDEENEGWEPDFNSRLDNIYRINVKKNKLDISYDSGEFGYRLASLYKYFKSREIGKKILAKFNNEKLIKYWI